MIYALFPFTQRSLIGLLLFFYLPLAQAYTWADPGDMELRHDLQLLNDSDLINISLATWPGMTLTAFYIILVKCRSIGREREDNP